MSLINDKQTKQLLANGSAENRDRDHPPVVKLCLPGTDCIWLLSELDHEMPHIAFGLCDLGMGFPELGYVDLNELTSINFPGKIACDVNFEGKYPMSVYTNAASICRYITTDEALLARHHHTSPKPS